MIQPSAHGQLVIQVRLSGSGDPTVQSDEVGLHFPHLGQRFKDSTVVVVWC